MAFSACKWTLMIISNMPNAQIMSPPKCYRNPPSVHDCTIHQNTVEFLQKRPISQWGEKHLAWKMTSLLRSAAENILPQHCQNHRENIKRRPNANDCISSFKLGGNENQKQNVKTYFQKKGRPVLNTVHKILAHSSIFLSMKMRPHSDKQQGNTASLKNLSSLSFF